MNSSAARNWLVLSLVLALAMVVGIGYVVYQGTGRTDAARMEGLVKEFEAAGIPVDEPSQPEKQSPLGRALLAVWGGTGARFRDAGRGGAFAEAYQSRIGGFGAVPDAVHAGFGVAGGDDDVAGGES